MIPILASLAFGFVKGLSAPEPQSFRLEQDFLGPVKEELLYRGLPLWVRPQLPFGTTAAVFALDHIVSDMREQGQGQMQPWGIIARLGDVFFGGCLYEAAFRQSGVLGAIGAHSLHNLAISWGSKARA